MFGRCMICNRVVYMPVNGMCNKCYQKRQSTMSTLPNCDDSDDVVNSALVTQAFNDVASQQEAIQDDGGRFFDSGCSGGGGVEGSYADTSSDSGSSFDGGGDD